MRATREIGTISCCRASPAIALGVEGHAEGWPVNLRFAEGGAANRIYERHNHHIGGDCGTRLVGSPENPSWLAPFDSAIIANDHPKPAASIFPTCSGSCRMRFQSSSDRASARNMIDAFRNAF